MDNLDELKGLDELFESREVLQDKGTNAINALRYLIAEEKLSGEFYPALNQFMIEFIDRFNLTKRLANVNHCDVTKFMIAIDKDEDKRAVQKSISIIKNIILKYKGLMKHHQYDDNKLNKAFGFYSNAESEIEPEDVEVIRKNKQIIKFIAERNQNYISPSSFCKRDGMLIVFITSMYPEGIKYLIEMNLKDVVFIPQSCAISLFKLDN
jgi:hypothetical protein